MPVARSASSFPGLAFQDSSSSNGSLSTGAKAGIGVGVSVGGILILLAIGFLIVRRRKRRRNGQRASQDTSSLDEENPDPAREKVELPATGRHAFPHQLPELSSNGSQSLYVQTTSPTESVQGRVELPAPESDGSATVMSASSVYTERSPRSPGAGSTVRYSQAELEGHQVPELAPSPLFSKELGR